jgi:hypothetical protein
LLVLALGYAAQFAAYYPPLPGVEDEVGFVNQAVVWSRGAVSAEGAGWPALADFAVVGGRHVSTRHPGRSLVALPFLALGGVRAVFASGLLLHLVMTGIGATLLARLGRSPRWAALLLFHPTLALYSRTVMADGAAGTGLLLAALAVTSSSRRAGLWAGLAVGLAALMRYHAGLALPVVAAAFVVPPGRPRPCRDAALYLAAGSAAGALMAGYNLVVYGAPMEPFSASRGYFSPRFFSGHALFYAGALMVIWPAMVLAPVLDRSPLRWLVRGLCLLFLAPLTVNYFHDRRPHWLEELVVGQRLLQVVLPVWVVSYAGVVDEWVAGPLRRALGGRTRAGLVGILCAGLLASNGLLFARHQRHLLALREARDQLVARMPEGSLVLQSGSVYKLVGVPLGVPTYRLRSLEYEGRPAEPPEQLLRDLGRETRRWFLAVLHRSPGAPLSPHARDVIDRFALEPVPVRSPLVSLYRRRSSVISHQ